MSNRRAVPLMTIMSDAVNPLNAGVTCPAITPTLGAELLANPGFEGVYENEGAGLDLAPNWSNSGADAGADTLAESATAHGGSKSQRIAVNTGGEGIVTDANVFASIGWYQYLAWVNITSGVPRITDLGGRLSNAIAAPTGEWTQVVSTGRTNATNRTAMVRAAITTATDFLVDDASAKAITLSSMLSVQLGTLSGRNGTYTCHPTVALGTQAGMVIAYLDANNFVLAIVDRLRANATTTDYFIRLLKYISGVWTEVISDFVSTYSDEKELKVIVSGTGYSLFYDGTQVGTEQTISDTLGEGVYGFNAYAGNSVGVVTANP